MAVKILIKRVVPKDKERALNPLIVQLRKLAKAQAGFMSGETLRNVDLPEEFLVISTWESLEDWLEWCESPQRTEIQEQIDSLLENKTEYSAYELSHRAEKSA